MARVRRNRFDQVWSVHKLECKACLSFFSDNHSTTLLARRPFDPQTVAEIRQIEPPSLPTAHGDVTCALKPKLLERRRRIDRYSRRETPRRASQRCGDDPCRRRQQEGQ